MAILTLDTTYSLHFTDAETAALAAVIARHPRGLIAIQEQLAAPVAEWLRNEHVRRVQQRQTAYDAATPEQRAASDAAINHTPETNDPNPR